MRRSNLMFSKGTVVTGNFTTLDPVLSNRPMLIVSNPLHLMGTATVVSITSREAPGIKCFLWNFVKERAVGNRDEGVIQPYAMSSIKTSEISFVLGQMDPFIMKKVDESIDFFLGRTDVIPEYLEGLEEAYYGVEYSYPPVNPMVDHPIYTSLNEKVSNEFIHNMAATRYTRMGKEDTELFPSEDEISEPIKEEAAPEQEEIPEPPVRTSKSSKAKTAKKIRSKNRFPASPEEFKKSIRVWKGAHPINKKLNKELKLVRRVPVEINKLLDSETMALIASRALPVGEIANQYELSIAQAKELRENVTKLVLKYGEMGLSLVNSKTDPGMFPSMIKLGMYLYSELGTMPVNEPKLIVKLNPVLSWARNRYRIDFENGKTWKVKPTIDNLPNVLMKDFEAFAKSGNK